MSPVYDGRAHIQDTSVQDKVKPSYLYLVFYFFLELDLKSNIC